MGRGQLFAVLTATLLVAMPAAAWAQGVSSARDLLATIALQGKPCDKLVDIKRNGDSDYSVTCKDGNRYRIYVNAQGRVIVEPR